VKKRLAVIMRFNRDDSGVKNAWRYRKNMARREWWVSRLDILQRFTLPSLANQSLQDFDLYGLFLRQDDENSAEVRQAIEAAGGQCVYTEPSEGMFGGAEAIRENYRGWCDHLVLINLDSDDMYGRYAFRSFDAIAPGGGLCLVFEEGYILGVDGRLFEYDSTDSTPPFLAMMFSGEAFESDEAWWAYRDKWGLQGPHHKVRDCPRVIVMSGGQFCYLIHGENVVSSWENSHTKKKLRREITNSAERARVLGVFGVKDWTQS